MRYFILISQCHWYLRYDIIFRHSGGICLWQYIFTLVSYKHMTHWGINVINQSFIKLQAILWYRYFYFLLGRKCTPGGNLCLFIHCEFDLHYLLCKFLHLLKVDNNMSSWWNLGFFIYLSSIPHIKQRHRKWKCYQIIECSFQWLLTS